MVLFRRVSDDVVESRLLDVKAMMKSRNLKEDIHLKAGDMVFVPQNTISKIRRYLPTSSLGTYMSLPQVLRVSLEEARNHGAPDDCEKPLWRKS